jgi:hypothetical protein
LLKLYRRKRRTIEYHEAWVNGPTITEHWGKVGDRGKTRDHAPQPGISDMENLERVLAPARSKGFAPIAIDDHSVLMVEYRVEGHGTSADVDKRQNLESRLNETLGWTGLGHCDGGSIGSGTMEACCFVVDFTTALKVIEHDLKGTPFADFARIYDERSSRDDG